MPDRVVLAHKGATAQLHVKAADGAGNALDVAHIEWKSLDENIVTVSPAGLATAVRSGEGRVRAFVGDLRPEAVVRVAIIGSIEVDPASIMMGTGSTRRFSAHVLDDRGQPMLGVGGVTWATSDPNIATVDREGNVTTINEGEVRVVARTTGIEGASMLVVQTGLKE